MVTRKDGAETRKKILDAACEVFSEHGFRDATHAQICKQAGANTAAINYHFGSKAGLYRATWEYALSEVNRIYPMHGGVASGASPEERLRGNISALVRMVNDRGRMGFSHNMRVRESIQPTGVLNEVLGQHIMEKRKYTRSILAEILGPDSTEQDLNLCEMSVFSQCRILRPHHDQQKHLKNFSREIHDTEQLIDHITRFSLAGLMEVRRQIEARKEQS